MARQKKPVHRVQMTEGKRNIIHQLLEEYDIQSAEDIQDALKDLLGGTIKEMMEAEMDDHLGYEKSERSDNDDYRNGYKRKQVNSRYGSMEIEVPQDRKSTFEPRVVKKRQKDISDIDQKIISMYAKGMTTRQISETIEDIYGFETLESFISDVTDKILPQIEDWQNRPLDEVYPILYIDAIHYSVRDNVLYNFNTSISTKCGKNQLSAYEQPVILVLTLFVWLCTGLIYISSLVLGLLSTVIALLGVAVLIIYSPQNGVILLVIAFLISPMGLLLAAIWLLGKVQDLKFAIQDWMYG